MRWWILVTCGTLAACGSKLVGQPPPIEVTAEDCADFCAGGPREPVPGSAPLKGNLTPLEQTVVNSVLVEVRRGIRPYSDEAIGVCRGRKTCDKFLGPDPGKLGRGTFFVRALLKVPPGPKGTWTVDFRTDCTSPGGEAKTFERTYDVVYAGPDTAFELVGLRTIESPSPEGAQDCKYTLTTKDANGAKTKYTGHWEVFGKE